MSLTKAIERLEKLLAEKEEALAEVGAKLEEAEEELSYLKHEKRWEIPKQMSEEKNFGLPIPRMECRTYTMSDRSWQVYRSLVLRTMGNVIMMHPLCMTKIHGMPSADGLKDPFRSGADMRNDAKLLGIPCFLVNDETGKFQIIES